MMWLAKLLYPDATAQYNMYNDAHEYYELFYTPDLLKKIMGPNPVKLEEELEYMHDTAYWSIAEMESNEEVWADWLRQNNEYAVGDRKAMEAGSGKYLNFIAIVLRKK